MIDDMQYTPQPIALKPSTQANCGQYLRFALSTWCNIDKSSLTLIKVSRTISRPWCQLKLQHETQTSAERDVLHTTSEVQAGELNLVDLMGSPTCCYHPGRAGKLEGHKNDYHFTNRHWQRAFLIVELVAEALGKCMLRAITADSQRQVESRSLDCPRPPVPIPARVGHPSPLVQMPTKTPGQLPPRVDLVPHHKEWHIPMAKVIKQEKLRFSESLRTHKQ